MKRVLNIMLLSLALTGCATTQDPQGPSSSIPADPLEPMNRAIYAFNKGLDRFVLKPVTTGYVAVTPHVIQTGITNFFNHLRLIPSMANSILQGKKEALIHNTGRFVMNTTLGGLGFFDLASDVALIPHFEDFGQTLATWGVKESNYLVLPFYGPSTFRDGLGIFVDQSYLSVWPRIHSQQASWILTGVNMVDNRAKLMKSEAFFDAASLDEYVLVRHSYLQMRNMQINEVLPEDTFEDFADETPIQGELVPAT